MQPDSTYPQDLSAARTAIAQGRASSAHLLARAQAAAAGAACRHAFIRRFDAEAAEAVARAVDAQCRAGVPPPALAGLA